MQLEIKITYLKLYNCIQTLKIRELNYREFKCPSKTIRSLEKNGRDNCVWTVNNRSTGLRSLRKQNNAGELYNCPGSLPENAFPDYVTLRWNSNNAQISH